MSHGIVFSEIMAGPFALGETDPAAGRERGQREETHLTMNAEVSIPDLETFIADPRHLGGLAGSIDFAPLGTGIPASSGAFNLFSPSGDRDMKLMVYEMAIESGGQDYYLAGHKEVKNDAGFDLWSDTTTLHTTLHEGSSKASPVVGAGILTLGMGDLLDLLATVRVRGTDSAAEIAATITRFGTFFMGELWETYGAEALRLRSRTRED